MDSAFIKMHASVAKTAVSHYCIEISNHLC